MSDLLFRGGRIVHCDAVRDEDILVRDGKFAAVGEGLPVPPGAEVVDCTGRLIFPGIIDPHTHMGIPIKGGMSADDFASGSRAAVHGGVTTLIDFTVLRKNQSLRGSVYERKRLAEASVADVSLHCNVTRYGRDTLAEIPAVFDEGIVSFKVFTTYREAGMMLTYDQIREVARQVAERGGLLMVHAEDDEVVRLATERLVKKGGTDPALHGESRPDEAEEKALEKVRRIAMRTGCKAYIVHLSSGRGLASASGGPLLLETCPQYLLLDRSAYRREDGRMYVASPPLRTPADNRALWRGVETGAIQTLGTDHCPFRPEDKPAGQPFQDIPNGIGGVETLFPLMLAQFLKRDMELPLLTRLLSTNAARYFGLSHRKGRIAAGMDADLVVADPDRVSTDWSSNLVSAAGWTAFEGFPAIFPDHVLRRGEWMVRDSSLTDPTPGQFLAAVPKGDPAK